MKRLTVVFLLLSLACLAQQAPTYTETSSHACNISAGDTCNGLPLDQGGTWQFIALNEAFSITSNNFYIYGNPGNPGSGGINNFVDSIKLPARIKNAIGPEGTITFNFTAVNVDRSLIFTGHVTVSGHKVAHVTQLGSWSYQTIVDEANIYIDAVQ